MWYDVSRVTMSNRFHPAMKYGDGNDVYDVFTVTIRKIWWSYGLVLLTVWYDV